MKISLLLAILVLAVAVACGAQNSGTNATPTAAPTVTPTAVATPTPGSGAVLTLSPGVIPPNLPFPFTPGQPIPPIIGELILNVSSSNISGLAAQVQMQQIACTTAQGAGGPPKCKPGDSSGTIYTVFPSGACEVEWATDARAALTPLFAQTPQLYAAVEVKAPNPDPEPALPKGQYAVLFTTGGTAPGVYFVLDGSNILRAQAMCPGGGAGAEITQLRQLGASAFLIPPR